MSKFPLVTLLALAVSHPSHAQEVSTLVPSINASGGLTTGPDGNIYAADFGNTLSNANGNTVYRISPEGEVTVFATGFSGASGNAFDADGNLIQANIAANRIDQVDSAGNRTTIASGLASPVGVAIGSDGTIFVANCGGNSIAQIADGAVTTLASGGPLSCPNGLTIDADGNLYTANFNNGDVIRITPAGQMSVLATTPTSSFRPSGGNGHITFGNGRLYVVSNAAAQIFELSLDGDLQQLAGDGSRGHADGTAATSSFSSPNGITLSADGRFLYVNEAESTQGTVLIPPSFPLNPSLVRVIDLGSSFSINPGLNGAWFDPNASGQGVLFDVVAATQTFFGAWFTYDAVSHGSSVRRWLTLQGPYDGAVAALDVLVSEGGRFDSTEPVSTTMAGSATLEFSSCTEAELQYTLDSGLSGSIALSRLTPDVFCSGLSPAQNNVPESPEVQL